MSAPKLVLVDGDAGAAPIVPATADGIRVVIADGHALVRGGLRALLGSADGVSVIGEAGDCDEAVALARREAPDVLLIDFDLPGAGAIDAIRLLLGDPAHAHMGVVMLTTDETDERVFAALRVGVTGFLLKDAAPGELVDALHSVADGQGALSPSVTRRVMDELASLPEPNRPAPEDLEELTPRERDVVALVAGGLSNDEIAERLVVSPATAKTHVSRALCKLAARDRAQLVTIAYETGLVVPGPQRRTPAGLPLSVTA